jgi:hypothetical protein
VACIFKKRCRIHNNRQSDSVQLLKQFILFPLDEDTIQLQYKYSHYELQQALEHLHNACALHQKLSLLRPFQLIIAHARKRAIYLHPRNIKQLVDACDHALVGERPVLLRKALNVLISFNQSIAVSEKYQCQQWRRSHTKKVSIEN